MNSTSYPEINTLVEYAYNDRILLTNITAKHRSTSTVLFQEDITYDDYGQGIITGRVSKVGTLDAMPEEYTYDDLGQLLHWGTEYNYHCEGIYEYDAIGNRTFSEDENNVDGFYNYHDLNGPNRLTSYFGCVNDRMKSKYFTYNSDGELSTRLTKSRELLETMYTQRSEEFSYDYRGLLDRYIFNDMFLLTVASMSSKMLTGWNGNTGIIRLMKGNRKGCTTSMAAMNAATFSLGLLPSGACTGAICRLLRDAVEGRTPGWLGKQRRNRL